MPIFVAVGLFNNGAIILIISRYPFSTAKLIGVNPLGPGVLGLSDNGANILRISNCTKWFDMW